MFYILAQKLMKARTEKPPRREAFSLITNHKEY